MPRQIHSGDSELMKVVVGMGEQINSLKAHVDKLESKLNSKELGTMDIKVRFINHDIVPELHRNQIISLLAKKMSIAFRQAGVEELVAVYKK